MTTSDLVVPTSGFFVTTSRLLVITRWIPEGGLPAGSVYTIGTNSSDNRLALFLIQLQMNRGSGRIVPLGELSTKMKEAIKTADADLKANLRNLGIDRDLSGYDFSIQAINSNQAREGGDTAIAFFVSLVSAITGKPLQERTVVLGEMIVQGMLLKATALAECMQFAGAARRVAARPASPRLWRCAGRAREVAQAASLAASGGLFRSASK